jgi:hypothetical protein
MTDLCSQLYRDPNHEGWNDFDLSKLPSRELEFLSRIMGIAHSGTKEKRIVRLLSCRIVRKELSRFADDPGEVEPAFKRERLKWMCQQAGLWRSGNKRALATVLLNWRNRCRLEGQIYLQACINETKAQPIQLNLPMI